MKFISLLFISDQELPVYPDLTFFFQPGHKFRIRPDPNPQHWYELRLGAAYHTEWCVAQEGVATLCWGELAHRGKALRSSAGCTVAQ